MTSTAEPVLVRLANLGRPRRPAGTRVATAEGVLPDLATATRQLGEMVAGTVDRGDLAGLRELHQFAQQFVRSVAEDAPAADPADINSLVRDGLGYPQLDRDAAGDWRVRMTWLPAGVVAELARTLVIEIAELDPQRFKICARSECTLVFYDRTRSRTQLWHAENPCGWRARQARHRST